MKIRRIAFAIAGALIITATAAAQESPATELLRDIGLEENQIEQILEIEEQARQEMRIAQAELQLLRASLTRELLESPPDRQRIREILRDSVEWEYQLHLTRVERELDIRAIVGDSTWGRLVQARGRMRDQGPHPMDGHGGPARRSDDSERRRPGRSD